nr:hypothetical protein [Tanacetum cinerariifolium]
IWEAIEGKARNLGSIRKETRQNTTLQACDFHSDAFTKSAQKVEFLSKVVTSHVVKTVARFTTDTVRIAWRRHHTSRQREAHRRFGGLTASGNPSDVVRPDFVYIQTLFFIFYGGKREEL